MFFESQLVEALFTVLFILVLLQIFTSKKRKRLPPGPWGLPLLGNVLQFELKPYKTLTQWAQIYGPIFRLKMGTEKAIVISDHKLVRELLSDSATSGRCTNPIFLRFTRGKYGIINTDGPTWEKQRRFALRTLRDLGFAKNSMELMIREEVSAMLHFFRDKKGAPITGNRLFNAPVVNSLWHIISGKRCEWEVEGAQPGLLEALEEFVDAITRITSSGLWFCPILRFIIPGASGWTQYCGAIDKLERHLLEAIEEHLEHLDVQHPQDFIDHMLKEIRETQDPDSGFFKETGYSNLTASIFDLFIAGSETSSHTLSWAMLYLSHFEGVQRKVQEEIERVVGSSRFPSLADRPEMPYSEAVVFETLRFSGVVPTGVPHRMLADKEFHGYLLPKDTVLLVNHFWIMRDPQVWGDGEIFRPERFLIEDQSKLKPHDAFIPFSVGKRTCLGDGIAKDSIFLFVTSILQHFNISPDPCCNNSDLDCGDGLLRFPTSFKFVATSREN